jgi:NTP pyrophosphatase (non-canonical NTP hydrolase)
MMQILYYKKDLERGTKKTVDWLKDEIEELQEALDNNDIKAIEKEFADVLAWLASLANIINVDLEKAAISKYKNKCPKCGLSPCNC